MKKRRNRTRRFFRERKWLVAALATIGLLVAAGIPLRKPIMNLGKGWRAERFIAEAERHAEAGQWGEALRLASASAQLKPSLEAIRLQFRALKESRHPQILIVARALAQHEEATPEDVATGLGTFIDVGDLVAAQVIIDGLDAQRRKAPEARNEFVRFLLAKNRFDDALRIAASIDDPHWKNKANLSLAKEFLGSAEEPVWEEGRRRVFAVLQSEHEEDARVAFGLIADLAAEQMKPDLATAALARFPMASTEEAGAELEHRYLKWFLTKGTDAKPVREAITAHQPLQALERAAGLLYLHWILGIDEREMIAWETMSTFHRDQLESLARWLLKTGYPRDVIELTGGPGVQSVQSPGIFLARANALARSRLFRTLAEELAHPPKGIPPIDALAFQAAAARLAGREGDELAFWQKAFAQAKAKKTSNEYYRLASLARRFGAREWELRALAEAVDHPLGIPPFAKDLVPLFQWLAREDSERLLSISRRLLAREPANPVLLNNVCYLSCVFGDPDPELTKILAGLVDDYPRLAGFRGSLALSQFLLGDLEAARNTMEAMGVPPETMDAPKKAICAAILYSEGRSGDAESVASLIPWDSLSEGEAEFFRGLLARERKTTEKRAIFEKLMEQPPQDAASSKGKDGPGPTPKTVLPR